MAAMLGLSSRVQRAIIGHHERCDGTGYPSGQRTRRVSVEARILGVCDVYDSLANGLDEFDREPQVFEHLRNEERSRFDQEVVDALHRAVWLKRELGALTGAFA